MKIFGFCGWSGSGKTDLVCRLISEFKKKKLIVSSIKHTHHNVEIDKEGKDSYKHRKAGAKEVIFGGGKNWVLIHNGENDKRMKLSDLTKRFTKETDIIIVEGFKNSSLPKIEVYNSEIKQDLLFGEKKNIVAVVYDKLDHNISSLNLPKFHFDDTHNICKFILGFLGIK